MLISELHKTTSENLHHKCLVIITGDGHIDNFLEANKAGLQLLKKKFNVMIFKVAVSSLPFSCLYKDTLMPLFQQMCFLHHKSIGYFL